MSLPADVTDVTSQFLRLIDASAPGLALGSCLVPEDSETGRAAQLASAQQWSQLDDAWQEAFRQAWEALRTGNIPVGACATRPGGTIVQAARNRVTDRHGPAGQVFGSALAHAEINVLARLAFRQPGS